MSGVVPMLFIQRTSAPYVTYIHIRLPPFVRQSKEQLLRWSRNIPAETELDLTTMTLLGRARVSRMKIRNLRERAKRWYSIANFGRETTKAGSAPKRPWWMGNVPMLFYIGDKLSKTLQPTVWQGVLKRIRTP